MKIEPNKLSDDEWAEAVSYLALLRKEESGER